MSPYGKTYNIFGRSEDGRTIARGEYSRPEIRYLADSSWIFEEKVDGTNIRLIISDDGTLEVRGRSDRATVPAGIEDAIRRALPGRDELVAAKLTGICVYGEGYGPGIQTGGKYREDRAFVGFDVRTAAGLWCRRDAVQGICAALHLDTAPVVGVGRLQFGVDLVTRGLQSTYGPFFAEGLVARPAALLLGQSGDVVKCKIKHRDLFEGPP